MVIIFIIVGVVFFVVGISFIFKGYLTTPNPNSMIPLEKYNQLQKDLDAAKDTHASISQEFETTKKQLNESQEKFQDLITEKESLVEKNSQLEAQKGDSLRLQEVEAELSALKEKADTQAKEALGLIQSLKEENARLSTGVSSSESRPEENEKKDSGQLEQLSASIDELNLEKQNLKNQLAQAATQIQQLQDSAANRDAESDRELRQLKAGAEQLEAENKKLQEYQQEAAGRIQELEEALANSQKAMDEKLVQMQGQNENIAQLTEENQNFKNHLRQKQDEITKLNEDVVFLNREREQQSSGTETINGLKASTQMLQAQLEDRAVKIAKLEQELAALKQQRDDRLIQLENQLKHSEEIIQNLQADRETLSNAKVELEESVKKVKEFNGHLMEKDRLIQYELAKSRAQAMGFQKINEDFKSQIDEMSKTVELFKKRQTV